MSGMLGMVPLCLRDLETWAVAAVPGEYPVDILIENHEILFVMSNGSNKKYIQLALGQYTK